MAKTAVALYTPRVLPSGVHLMERATLEHPRSA